MANRSQARYNLRSANKGNSLLTSFPYSRMTCDEVSDLFSAYNITIGCGSLESSHIIQALKVLDIESFDQLIL